MEDGILRWLQHRHETCCEKGGHHGRQAYMTQRWFYHRDVISRQIDLHMTTSTCYDMINYGQALIRYR